MSSLRFATTTNHLPALETVEGSEAEWGRLAAVPGSFASAIVYCAENAGRFEVGEMLRHRMEGSSALAPAIEQGWRTYNFEVAGSHTYIANGVRVHNRSILAFVELDDFSFEKLNFNRETGEWDQTKYGFTTDENGVPRTAWIERDSGIREYYIGEVDPGDPNTFLGQKITEIPGGGAEGTPSRILTEWVSRGDKRNVTKVTVEKAGEAPGAGDSIAFDEKGKVLRGDIGGRSMSASDVMGALGSSIGGVLGGSSFIGSLAGRTIGGTFGQALGKFVNLSFSASALDADQNGKGLIDLALTEAFSSFGPDLVD